MTDKQHGEELKRGLKNRHIQLIALGGAIGTGLFLGIAQTIQMAGPSVLLGYAIGGFIAFLIMRQLGEMVVEEPVAGSFSHFAYKYWGNFAGFASGWNYWVLYVLVAMAELTAVGIYVHFWWPEVPTCLWGNGILVLHHQSCRHYGHDRLWCLVTGNRKRWPRRVSHQPLGSGGILPQWGQWISHGDGSYYVFVWWSGTGGHHCR